MRGLLPQFLLPVDEDNNQEQAGKSNFMKLLLLLLVSNDIDQNLTAEVEVQDDPAEVEVQVDPEVLQVEVLLNEQPGAI